MTNQDKRVSRALIPAAGRGTRMLPLTKAVPKELAPIVSTPALEYVVSEAAENGITDVLIVLSKEKEALAAYFSPHEELEGTLERKGDLVTLEQVRRGAGLATFHYTEQPSPRGLGDAIAQGEQFAGGEALAVLLPDDVIDDRDALLGPMIDAYKQFGGVVLGLIDVPRQDISRYGSVRLAEDASSGETLVEIADLVEKPPAETSTLAIIGRYVLPPEIFEALRRTEPGAGGEIQITDAIQILARDGVPIHGVVFGGRRYDTGNRLEYVKAVVQLATRHPEIGADFTAWLGKYVSDLTT
jgi:UTP--glucose-1-phosphate uridylyltransferase